MHGTPLRPHQIISPPMRAEKSHYKFALANRKSTHYKGKTVPKLGSWHLQLHSTSVALQIKAGRGDDKTLALSCAIELLANVPQGGCY